MSDPSARPSLLHTLGWALYLAVSWTWCIGMFLPALLVRDYGVWGFVVFAVPNVIGAAAMGWVLRTGVSERLVAANKLACDWFSVVTIVFQAFFFFTLPEVLWGPNASAGTKQMALALMVPAMLCLIAPRIAATLVWLASVVFLLLAWKDHGYTLTLAPSPQSPIDLMFLAPVCAFGLALCPYLDHTFHLARQRSGGDAAGRIAFSLGFGVFFFAMILGTLIYAADAITLLDDPKALLGTTFASLIGAHIATQLVATIAFHYKAMAPDLKFKPGSRAKIIFFLAVAALTLFVLAAPKAWFGITPWEVVYRFFMAYYGLVFPAYVWLCMIPTRDGHSGIDGPVGRRRLVIFVAAIALAGPCFYLGFIERVEWWLAPGLGIVLLARLAVRGRIAAPAAA